MDQEQIPRFTHIAVGIPATDDEVSSEDEEVIVIGAVGGDTPTEATPTEEAPDVAVETANVAAKPSEDDPLGAPMPTTQKVVLALCFVGLVVAVVFIVMYWL